VTVEPGDGAARSEGCAVEAVHGARAAQHLLALQPVLGAGVLLDRERVGAEPHDELAGLGGQHGREGEGGECDDGAHESLR